MLFLSSFCFLVRRKLRLKQRKGLDALFSWFFKLHVCMVCWKLFSQLFQPGVTARAKGCTRFSSMNCGCDGLPWSGLGHCPSKTHQEACSYRRMFDIHFSVWRVQIDYFGVLCCYFQPKQELSSETNRSCSRWELRHEFEGGLEKGEL